MALEDQENLPDEYGLALAHTPVQLREPLAVVFALDQRLARIVASATEPMLAQIRLTWWRETFQLPIDHRPSGDAVLDAAGQHCSGQEAGLIALVDGWEHLLQEPPLGEDHALGFANGRVDALQSVIGCDPGSPSDTAIKAAVMQWALADLAANVSDDDERTFLTNLASVQEQVAAKLPRNARGLAVLAALGRRALKRGGRPLMEGRGAALVALRAGLIGS